MKKLVLLIALLVVMINPLKAELIRFRIPSLNGKLTSEQIDITDFQSVLSCHYFLNGKINEIAKYPAITLKKLDNNSYFLNIRSTSLFEAIPRLEIKNCAFKILLVGKNKLTLQNHFGEIYLLGSEHGQLSSKEIEALQNKDWVAKTLNHKLKDLVISIGTDGGIVLVKNYEE